MKAIYINEAAFVDGVVTGATNLGSGNGTIYTSVSDHKIQLKTLSGGSNITITCNGQYVAINSTASGTVTGATNGLTLSGKNIELGGVLYKDTLICYSGKSFEIKTNSGYCGPYMCMDAYTPQAEIGAYHIGGDGCYGTLFAQYNNTQLGVVDNTNKSATLTSSLTTGRPYNELGSACGSIKTSFIQYPENIHILTNTGMTISGASSFAGIRYCGDYSANFVDRSLVDKGWVLNQGFITGGTSGDGITGATNGLSVSGKNIGLGGTLTGNTVISGGTSPYDFKLCGLNSFFAGASEDGIDNYVSVGGGNANLYGGLSTISLTSCCWCATNYYPASTTCTVIKMDRSNGIYLLSTANDIVINATCTADSPTSANVCIIGRDCVILTGGTGIYLCGLQAKSSETCVVYIDSNGSLSTGTVGAGASALSTYLISGDSSATGFTVNHALNKQFVMVQIVQAASPYATVYTDVLRPNANCVCITFSTAPTTGTNYRILISG